jgi:hypothetical protein
MMKKLITAIACVALLGGCAATSPRHAAAGSHTGMEMQVQAMQGMHEKMKAAKTPEERQLLMQEQMRLMHGGMDMLAAPGAAGGGMGDGHHEAMEARMKMMESMMQMMMDRMDPMNIR